MNVSLPKPLKRRVDSTVSEGMYGSASEYVREAIREKLQRDQEREQARALLTGRLLEGLDSGKPIHFNNGYFKAKKRALIRRVGGHRGA
jgi:putative addiction module CopG family antidote